MTDYTSFLSTQNVLSANKPCEAGFLSLFSAYDHSTLLVSVLLSSIRLLIKSYHFQKKFQRHRETLFCKLAGVDIL